MPIGIARNALNVRRLVRLRAADGSPYTGKSHAATPGFEVAYWSYEASQWVAMPVPVNPVLGVYQSGGWAEVGEGVYELGVPNEAVTPDGSTDLRIRLDGGVVLFDTIEATGLGVSGVTAPFLQRRPSLSRVLDLSSRADGYLVHGDVRLPAYDEATQQGSRETWWLRMPGGHLDEYGGPWWHGMTLPVSADPSVVAVVGELDGDPQWGVNRELAGFTVEPVAGASAGDRTTLAVRVEPEPGRWSTVPVPVVLLEWA